MDIANGVAIGPADADVYHAELCEVASELIEQGLPVTVCNGKNPGDHRAMGDKWQNQKLTAKDAERLLPRVPLPAIGIRLGPDGGAIDFDIDGPDELEAFAELCGDDLPILPTYTSGREGGEHRLAAFDDRLLAIEKATVTYKTTSGKKITVRIGSGGRAAQSIVPPSYHVTDKDGPLRWSGKRYTWKPTLSVDDLGLPKLPDSIIEKLIEVGVPKPSKSVDVDLTDTATPTTGVVSAMIRSTRNLEDKGDGSKRLFVCCCRLHEHSLSGAAAVAAVRAYEAQRPFPREYSDEEILKRLADVAARGDIMEGSALLKRRELTDLGNAERFVARYGDRVRYVTKWDQWLVNTGSRWTLNETGEVERLAKRTAKAIYAEASLVEDEDEAKAICKHARASQSRSRLDAMLAVAQSELPIPVRHESLDADPWLLNCENGVVDLRRTGKLLPHDAGLLLTKTTGLEYPDGEGIDAPLFEAFLFDIFGGDTELIRFVQRLLGMALVGQQIEHVLPIFYGSGANGKSVLVNIIHAALNDYSMIAPPGLLMTARNDRHPTELVDLFGKRLVVLSETKDGQKLDEGLVKATTGGDRIRARRMREDHWEFTPSHTPIVVTNHKPLVQGDDFGIWRRLRLVPFTVTIPPERQDRHLPDKLRKELPAILRWLVEGCLAWQRDGLQEPDAVRAATDEYRTDSDSFARWLAEECVVTPNAMSKASVLLKRYRDWCESNGENPLSHRRFGERLGAQFAKEKQSRGVFYLGLGLASQSA